MLQAPKAGSADRESDTRSTSADADADISDEETWGRCPASIASLGTDESFRKFAACRRKYLVMYLELLATTGGTGILMAAHQFLTSQHHWPNLNMMSDIAR